MEFCSDGGAWKRLDTFTPWSPGLHLPWALILNDELSPGRHVARVRIAADHNPKSTGTKAATTVAKWPHQSVSIVGLGVGSSASDVTDQDKMDDHCLVCHSAIGTSY